MFFKILKKIAGIFINVNAGLIYAAFISYVVIYHYFGSTALGYVSITLACGIAIGISYWLAIKSADRANEYNSAEELSKDNDSDLISILFCMGALSLWLFLLGYPDIEIFDMFYYIIMLLFFITMLVIAMVENSRTVKLGAKRLELIDKGQHTTTVISWY